MTRPATGPPTREPNNPPLEPNATFLIKPNAAPPTILFFIPGDLSKSCVFLDTNPPILDVFPSSSFTSGPNT
jgi:hypothetical protein